MGEFSPWHLLIVAIVFVVLFGSKRLPEAARSLGRSMRILKAETAGLRGDTEAPPELAGQLTPTAVLAPTPVSPLTAAASTSPQLVPVPQSAAGGSA